MSSARAALEYFNVPDVDKRLAEYAQRKQAMPLRLIDAGGELTTVGAFSHIWVAERCLAYSDRYTEEAAGRESGRGRLRGMNSEPGRGVGSVMSRPRAT
jgi:hypothetical protein